MPKKILKRVFPSPDVVKSNPSLRFLSPLFSKTNLWHLNRRSVSRAFFIGLLVAFLPLPFQMFIVAFVAFYVNANVPISVGLVWISNPVTAPPLFYATYVLGTWILDSPPHEFSIELSIDWFMSELAAIWKPLWVGSLLTGFVLGVSGYIGSVIAWRLYVLRLWEIRRLKRLKKANLQETES